MKLIWILGMLLFVFNFPASGQSRLKKTAPANSVPKVTSCPEPIMTKKSVRNEETGIALVRALVGMDGKVKATQILISTQFKDLDESAISAMEGCKFEPSILKGKPSDGTYLTEYSFSNEDVTQAKKDRDEYSQKLSDIRESENPGILKPSSLKISENFYSGLASSRAPRAKNKAENNDRLDREISDAAFEKTRTGTVELRKENNQLQLTDSRDFIISSTSRKSSSIEPHKASAKPSHRELEKCRDDEKNLLSSLTSQDFLKRNDNLAAIRPDFGTANGVLDACLMRNVFTNLVMATERCEPEKAERYRRYVEAADATAMNHELMDCPKLMSMIQNRYFDSGFFFDKFSVENDESKAILEASARLRHEREARIRNTSTTQNSTYGSPSKQESSKRNECRNADLTGDKVCTVR